MPDPSPLSGPVPEWQCPKCHRTLVDPFCEKDGIYFANAGEWTDDAEAGPAVAGGDGDPARPPPSQEWFVVATADIEYFEFVRATGGDNPAVAFPPFCPARRFPLRSKRMLIGRYSASRGTDPDIDLTGPPEDRGIGRSHAQLIAQPNGQWELVILSDINPSFLNDYTSKPIEPNTPVPLSDGDRIYLGAWTALTIQRLNGTDR